MKTPKPRAREFVGLLTFPDSPTLASDPLPSITAVDSWATNQMADRRERRLSLPSWVRVAEVIWQIAG